MVINAEGAGTGKSAIESRSAGYGKNDLACVITLCRPAGSCVSRGHVLFGEDRKCAPGLPGERVFWALCLTFLTTRMAFEEHPEERAREGGRRREGGRQTMNESENK